MFVVLISSFISIGLCQFIVDSARVMFTSTEKNDIVSNIRQFTGEMESVAKSSNVAYVYKTFNSGDRATSANRLHDGQSGNFVMFISVQANTNPLNPDQITKIVGYFLTPDATGTGPLKKFTLDYSAAPLDSVANPPETLIAGLTASSAQCKELIQLVQGLSSGNVFYDYMDRSVMVKSKFIQGNSDKRVTNTYSFTISPRG